jgi:hypothetical protein
MTLYIILTQCFFFQIIDIMGNTTSSDTTALQTQKDVIGTIFGNRNDGISNMNDYAFVSAPQTPQEVYSQLQKMDASRNLQNQTSHGNATFFIPASETPLRKSNMDEIQVYDIYIGDQNRHMKYRHYDDTDIVDHDCKVNCICIEGLGKNNDFSGGASSSSKIRKEKKTDDSPSDDLPNKKTAKKVRHQKNSDDSDHDSLSDDLDETTEIDLEDISSDSSDEEGGGIFGEKGSNDMRRALNRIIDDDDHDDDMNMNIYDDDKMYKRAVENRLTNRESRNKMNPHRVNLNLKSKFFYD